MKGTLGSFIGTAKAGENLIDQFRQKEANGNRKWPRSLNFSVLQIAINASAGTLFKINGESFKMPTTGIFELGYGLVEIDSLAFESDTDVNIVYLY